MPSTALSRCVHLDFHTSPDIPGIGENFSKENFQNALKAGHLTSITVFAKCHHGYCYYPTKVGTMHPGLSFDLLGAMIEAAHEIGVKIPVYITTGWSALDAEEHPEWRAKNKDGSYRTTNYDDAAPADATKPFCSWRHLCLNDSPYCEHIYETVHEVCKRYRDLDGLFFDICVVGDTCYCDHCKAEMQKEGVNVDDDAAVRAFFSRKHGDFMRKCGEILHSYHPNATIFFNSGGAEPGLPQYHEYETHFEMEDLPTAWGGYDKLPPRARYFAQKGKPYLGMTGKFHLDWGEFGGYKPKEALKYEACTMALYGAGCSIGDHLHPDGEMDKQTYENIGYAFSYYEKIAPYCVGASTANLGVYYGSDGNAVLGISAMLEEEQIAYEFVLNGDFARFDTVIVPEGSHLSASEQTALVKYVQSGGKVLFFGDALIENGAFTIPCGARYVGPAAHELDYLQFSAEAKQDLPCGPVLCVYPGQAVAVTDGTVLAEILPPYFNRTYAHYCGHKNTPYDKNAPRTPGIVQKGGVIYASHKLASLYHTFGSLIHRRFFMELLDRLYTDRPLRIGIGLKGRAALVKQEGRYCLNVTYASPVKNGCAEIIADLPTLTNVPVTVAIKEPIKRVYLPLKDRELAFAMTENGCEFVLPALCCHETVVLEY